MATQTELKNIVKLSEAQYSELVNNGSVTSGGITITYDANTLYMTNGDADAKLNSNIVAITDGSGNVTSSGVSVSELNALVGISGNLQDQLNELQDLINSSGTNFNYVDSTSEIDKNTPGTYYVAKGDGTYDVYKVDSAGKISLVDMGVAGNQAVDLSAYQKITDSSLNVYSTTGMKQSTVPNAINTIESKLGTAYPLATTAQTITGAINELKSTTGTGSGSVSLNQGSGIQVSSYSGTYTISHANTYNPGTIGNNYNGRSSIPALLIDSTGHVNTNASTAFTAYIPTSGGYDGQVWTWDATNNIGKWQTVTSSGGGSYTAGAGLTLDGTTFRHQTTGVSTGTYGNSTTGLTLTFDSTGHVINHSSFNMYPPTSMGTANQYLAWNNSTQSTWTTPITSASGLTSTTEKLVSGKVLFEVTNGYKINKVTQSQYSSMQTAGTLDSQTIYFITA